MATPNNLDEFLSTLYGALSSADLAAWSSLQADDVIYNVNGSTAVSGRAVVIFEGESTTLEGVPYNNRYLQTMEFNDEGKICEVWEFFDTALAEGVLFTADQTPPPGTEAFQY